MIKQIPNLLTLGNLYCGYLSISYIISGDVRNATILIFIALMLDMLDGRMARILGVANDLGKQLDSLADIVSFGVAPAFLASYTFFYDFGQYGIWIAGLFPLFGCYRLARFNITPTEESMKHFRGIPITFAGGVIAFLVLLENYIHTGLFIILFFGLAVLMVSTIRIPSFKKVKLNYYTVIITLFLLYMFYLIARSGFKSVPEFFYVAIAIYVVFIVARYIKAKTPKFKLKKSRTIKLPRKDKLRKKKAGK